MCTSYSTNNNNYYYSYYYDVGADNATIIAVSSAIGAVSLIAFSVVFQSIM